MQTRPAGVVFDMDGLLLDSERLAREAFEASCAALGVRVDPHVYLRCVGSNREVTAELLTDALGSEGAFRTLEADWEARYQARIERAPVTLKPGARELLAALQAYGIPRALATSTVRATATRKLERTGLISSFSCLICGGETERDKPHPDPYLAAVTALGSRPAETWALEDSENGVRAAHAAGLRVFQVPDLVSPSEALRALGHRVVSDLFEVLDALHAAREPD